jgi:hypothetical protein
MSDHLAPLEFWLKATASELRQHAFEASQFAASDIAISGIKADDARDIVIRLRALSEQRASDLADFRPMIEALTREVGLFPYVDDSIASYADRVARETFRSESDPELVFHVEQQRIFKSLLEGKNVVASAPTSFGKSLIIDSMLGQEHIKRAALIVPTLALLDETRRRILGKIKGDTTIVFHRSQTAPKSGRVIFIGTQERLLDRSDIGDLDILIVDEFYKADPSRSDSRFVALNAAISKLARSTKQFFLIGPFIDGIDARGWRYADVDFIKTSYRTVSYDPIDVQASHDDVSKLAGLLSDTQNMPALIFVKSPKSANDLAAALVKTGIDFGTDWSRHFADWAAENYTRNWGLIDALAKGVGYHHGRLPRAVASALVRAFNRGEFKVLICTSTLIEGVNTAAKSVFIWDKEIDGKNVDFFTFANIRGRAGRMGHHYVGKVFYFHPQPDEEENEVEVPGLGAGGDIDEILVHYERDEIDDTAQLRLTDWVARTGLSFDELKRFGGVGFGRLADLKRSIDGMSGSEKLPLSWRGFPKYRELKATAEFLWNSFNLTRSGPYTASQLTWLLWQLYDSKSLSRFLRRTLGGEKPMAPDMIFAFLRSCEFSYPEYFMCLQASLQRNAGSNADYSIFITRLENWFLSENVKSLEEVGFPIVLFEKLGVSSGADDSVDELITRAVGLLERREDIGSIEREMIRDASIDKI